MSLFRKTVLSFPLFFALYQPSAAFSDEISLVADEWCPINCQPNSSKPGVMIEIAQTIFEQAGHRVTYKLKPWARAIKDVRFGKFDAIVGASKGDAPDFIFPTEELMQVSLSSFFVNKNKPWRYQGLDSLKGQKLGAVKAYNYGPLLNHYIATSPEVQVLAGRDVLQRNIKKLIAGRIDVIVESAPVFWHKAEQMGLTDALKMVGSATKKEDCFIAFSPRNPRSQLYAQQLSEGVKTLKSNGQLQLILERYGLSSLL